MTSITENRSAIAISVQQGTQALLDCRTGLIVTNVNIQRRGAGAGGRGVCRRDPRVRTRATLQNQAPDLRQRRGAACPRQRGTPGRGREGVTRRLAAEADGESQRFRGAVQEYKGPERYP